MIVTLGAEENSKSTLWSWETNNIVREANTSDILSCGQFQKFWLSWDVQGMTRHIMVGYGNLYEGQPFLSYEDTSLYGITFLSFMMGNKVTAEWRFKDDAGEIMRQNLIKVEV